MITHVVLFRFTPDARPRLGEAREALAGLVDKVPPLLSASVGINVLPSDRAYDLCLIATFESLEALAEYRAHPEHRTVAAFVDAFCESTVSVDYES